MEPYDLDRHGKISSLDGRDRVVRGRVVHDDRFQVRIGLDRDALVRLQYLIPPIIGWGDNFDERRHGVEARLGSRLLQRTTRAVRLTEDGELYLEAARAALEGLSEAERALSARRDEPVGRVRIDIPIGFGQFLQPIFVRVRDLYLKVTIELSADDIL